MAKSLLSSSSSLHPALPLLLPLRLRRGRRAASCTVSSGLHGLNSLAGPHLQAALYTLVMSRLARGASPPGRALHARGRRGCRGRRGAGRGRRAGGHHGAEERRRGTRRQGDAATGEWTGAAGSPSCDFTPPHPTRALYSSSRPPPSPIGDRQAQGASNCSTGQAHVDDGRGVAGQTGPASRPIRIDGALKVGQKREEHLQISRTTNNLRRKLDSGAQQLNVFQFIMLGGP